MNNHFDNITCDDIINVPPIKEITGDDICGLKKDLKKIAKDMDEGKIVSCTMVGGPHDGNTFCIAFNEGKPLSDRIALSLNRVFQYGVEFEAAYYKWDKIKRIFVFDRLGKEIIHKPL